MVYGFSINFSLESLQFKKHPKFMKKFTSVLAVMALSSSVQALELSPCFIGKGGVSKKAQCGQLTVPVNRDIPDVTIDLNVAVIAAPSDKKSDDPLVLLAGGPGQGAVETYASMTRVFQSNLRDRDIILVDQRGTGDSHPLRCDVTDEDMESMLDVESDAWKGWLQGCKDSMDVDTHFFTTTDAIKDLEAVRQSLGIKQWNLYGGSYGTRKALTYMKMHPEVLRSVVLDSVVHQSEVLSSSHEENLQSTLNAVFERCKNQVACNEAFGDAEQQMWTFLDQLKETPIEMRLPNARTGELEDLTFTREHAVMAIRMFSYSPETMGMIPLLVSLANHGQPENLAYQAMMVGASLEEGLNNALELSVLCAEDAPFMREQRTLSNSLFGDNFTELVMQRCDIWDSVAVDASFKTDVESDIPTLLLSGELDPVTPPAFAEKAMETLSNAQHLVAKGQGHIAATRGCMPKIVGQFIADPKAELETECMDNFGDIPFFINLNGPKE